MPERAYCFTCGALIDGHVNALFVENFPVEVTLCDKCAGSAKTYVDHSGYNCVTRYSLEQTTVKMFPDRRRRSKPRIRHRRESLYAYYMILRPPSIGCMPKNGLVESFAFSTREMVPEINHAAWGVVFYNRPLTGAEIDQYDLMALPEEDAE